MWSKIIFILTVAVNLLMVSCQDVCDPVDFCANSEPGDYVIDPDNFRNYYVCISEGLSVVPSDDSFYCGSSMCFSPSFQRCVAQSGPTCYNECVNTCDVRCTDTQSIIANTSSCSDYYLCVDGNPVPESCPVDRPYFDGADCVNDASVCCDFCSPRCPQADVQVYDPYNCTMFYICKEAGEPNWNLHGACPNGEFFDPVYGRCEFGDDCLPAC